MTDSVLATELTHRFANPNFIGGDANKGIELLTEANAQNGYKAPVVPSTPKVTKTPLQQYADRVQAAVLSSVTNAQISAIKNDIIDKDTGLIKQNVDVGIGGGYTLTTSTAVDGSMSIVISDGISNTTFTVPYLTQ